MPRTTFFPPQSLPVVTIQNVSRHCPMSLWGGSKMYPLVRSTGLAMPGDSTSCFPRSPSNPCSLAMSTSTRIYSLVAPCSQMGLKNLPSVCGFYSFSAIHGPLCRPSSSGLTFQGRPGSPRPSCGHIRQFSHLGGIRINREAC